MQYVRQGANFIVRRELMRPDDSDLLIADVSEIRAELMQKSEVKKTWNYADETWPTGFSANGDDGIKLEVDSETCANLDKGKVQVRWTIKFANDDFTVDEGRQVDPIVEDVATII